VPGSNLFNYGADNFNPEVSFRDCLFSGNQAEYGGGMAALG
jgi:predicted outer membrane repeat protein